MSRSKSSFVCQACGAVSAKWSGRCEGCGAWNTIVEERVGPAVPGQPRARRGGGVELTDLRGEDRPPPRLVIGIEELDRVLGGGVVGGSVILLGGDPGIGKSTLTLQASAALARAGSDVVYVSGEESPEQIRLRAARLALQDAPVQLAAATSISELLATLERPPLPALVVVDSIQTMWVEGLDAAPGTVGQLRAAAHELVRYAKSRSAAVLLVGHVTKDGQIAGPRVLEHMVDAVLYFEGERGQHFRILRAIKNRFGPSNEIGVFEMRESGLAGVANPSALFLSEREDGVPGASVFAGMEGSRPVLVEVQALVSASAFGTPRRAVVGWDGNRLSMLLAVLEARCGLVTGARDVYLNVAGGLRLQEPAADLAMAAALISAMTRTALPERTVFVGEIGLAGEIRGVGQVATRLKEAEKLGFARAFTPILRDAAPVGLEVHELRRLIDLVEQLADDPMAAIEA